MPYRKQRYVVKTHGLVWRIWDTKLKIPLYENESREGAERDCALLNKFGYPLRGAKKRDE